MPYELLSSLAASLAQGQILEIVKMLTEVQQATEKHLFQQRLQSINQHNLEKQRILGAQGDVAALDERGRQERQQEDMRLVMQLDQKVSDQQVCLPGEHICSSQLISFHEPLIFIFI